MYGNYRIKPPFFEIGPKCIMWGERFLKLAKAVDRIAFRYDLDVILTPHYTDIRLIAENTERVHVYAQHMDPLRPGRGLGSVLPEAVKDAGAVGVMLNHAEKKLTTEVIAETVARADSFSEIKAVAAMHPNLIVAEPTELIGTGKTSSLSYVTETISIVRKTDPRIMVLQGAGISTPDDVRRVILAGAEATGCTSGIIKNSDPEAMAEEMLSELRRSWDEAHN